MQEKITPIGTRVAFAWNKVEEKRGSLFIPETGREEPQSATVIAAGPECKTLEPGDVIFLGYFQAHEVDGKDYAFIREEDVLAYVKGSEL